MAAVMSAQAMADAVRVVRASISELGKSAKKSDAFSARDLKSRSGFTESVDRLGLVNLQVQARKKRVRGLRLVPTRVVSAIEGSNSTTADAPVDEVESVIFAPLRNSLWASQITGISLGATKWSRIFMHPL